VGVIVATSLFMPAVAYFGRGDEQRGFFITALIIGVVSTVLLLVTFSQCKERYTLDTDRSVPFATGLKTMLRNTAWLVASGFGILNFIRFGAILALTPYFAINVLGQPWMISVLLPTLSGTLLLGAFFAPPILRRFGMRAGVSGALVVAAALYLVLPFTEATPGLFIAVYVAASLVLSITMTGIFTMASDAVDYQQYRFGSRQEGLLAAGIAFAIKVGMAFGGALVAWALAWAGYEPGNVSDRTRSVMSLLYYGIPLVVFALQFACAQFYPVDRVRDEMNAAIGGA
jgi:GPH family glycoside/pentoside/hexuronide:cation symporter